MDRLELCRMAVEAAIGMGSSEAEALILSNRTISSDIERGQITTCNDIADSGMAVRAILDGRIGFAYTNRLTADSAKEASKRAFKAARASPPDKQWRSLPESRSYPTVEGIFDDKIAQLTSDVAVDTSERMIEIAVGTDERVLPAFGGTEIVSQEMTCANSLGIEVEQSGTTFGCGLATVARSETEVSPMCGEFKASRVYDPQPEWVAEVAANLSVRAIKVGKPQSGKFPVLLDPFALQDILTYTLIESIKGDNVHRGKSALRGKVGQMVACEGVTIFDDGTLHGGLKSWSSDLEGAPKQRTPILADGVLEGFVYDNYWAKLEGKKSTGNAERGGGGLNLPAYGTTPSIQPSNIVLEPGTASEEELLRETGDGYYVRDVQGAHQSNPETGEFSVALAPAWRIENGEVTHAVKGTMIAGSVFDLMKNIAVIGKDARQVGTLVSPKVVVRELRVISE